MLSRERAQQILDTILQLSPADATEAFVGRHSSALTRFAQNAIHQNVAETVQGVSVRLQVGQRLGSASTTEFDEAALRRMVDAAVEAAKLSEPDPELLPLIGPQQYREVEPYDPAASTDALGPAERAAAVGSVVAACRENGLTAAGSFANAAGSSAQANSAGMLAFHESSSVHFSVTASADDGTGWAGSSSHRAADVDPAALGQRAIAKTLAGRGPREVEPRQYTVILEPEAVADLMGFLTGEFNALAVDEGRSCFTGKVGQKVVGENISITSDPYHPLLQGRPFDGEGLPRKQVTLIDKGVAANLVYDRLTAKKHGVEPTGHGSGGSNTGGAYPTSLVFSDGDVSLEDMIAGTDAGILLTRLWYLRTVDPMKLIVTGMTRDGTFWIEGGEIKYGLKNMRFNESVLSVLSNVVAMSPAERVGSMVLPAMKVENFTFTSGTEF
jgi:predicted Zn-dependent protease